MTATIHKAIADLENLEMFIIIYGLDPDMYEQHIQKIKAITKDLRTCIKEIETIM